MVKYKGWEVDVFLSATEAGLETVSAIPGLQSIEYSPEQNIESVPDGFGSRLRTLKEGIHEPGGSMTRHYDATVIEDSKTFAELVQAFTSGALSELFIKVYNKTTTKSDYLKQLKGTWNKGYPDIDGVITETFDFEAREITTQD